jgi:hypothetical protein
LVAYQASTYGGPQIEKRLCSLAKTPAPIQNLELEFDHLVVRGRNFEIAARGKIAIVAVMMILVFLTLLVVRTYGG